MGLGAYGLLSVLPTASSTLTEVSPLASREPHFPAKAKHLVHIFLNGGCSHVDTFDPKPSLAKYEGKILPTESLKTERPTGGGLPSVFEFKRYGESGIEISELFKETARHADEMCVVRSMHADVPNHEPSLLLMNTGESRLVRPSVGSWVTYGLGTDNQNLPGFIAMCPGGYPIQESANWTSGFLPGVYQGTYIDTNNTQVDKLIEHVRNDTISLRDQRRQLDLLEELNALHQETRAKDAEIEARIQSFELAYRMQLEATDAFDIGREPESVRERYGSSVQSRQLLIARRLIERGVRCIQLWHGAGQPWDNHDDLAEGHKRLAGQCDRGIAAFLDDLKERGLLEETLVLCCGEFGRTPTVELPTPGMNEGKQNGRDHNHYGFTAWLAGGGVKGGTVYGSTDEFGFQAVEKKVHVHDLHATMLHLLGFDHERLTYRHAGRDFRLTDVYGRVIHDLIA